ncbi:collagen alpha-1(XXVIII) chain-like [Salvelinus alpinus]
MKERLNRVTRASQGSTDHREREESWSQGQRVNQDLTDPLGYLVYLGKMERSNLRVRLVCQDCEGQRVRGKGIPGEKMLYLGEGTFMGSAILRANQLFQASRPGVHKVAVVLTDGQAHRRDAVQPEDAAGIEMFVIRVVNKKDPLYAEFQAEMIAITSGPDEEHVYLIDDFMTLPSM